MATTLAQLLIQYTQEEITDALLAIYQANGFPTTSYQPFGSERTRITSVATAANMVSNTYVPQIAASGFIQLAVTAAPDWVPLIGQQVYNLTQFPPQPAIGYMTLSNANTTQYNILAGQLIVSFPLTNNNYTNLNAITLAGSSTGTTALFQSVGTGSIYNDVSNQILNVITSLPGIGVTNPPQSSFGAHSGPSQGSITLAGTLTQNATIVVNISTSGSVYNTSFYFSYSLNGSAQSANILGGATYAVPGSGGVILDFTDASVSNPSNFYSGDSWTFNIPGSWTIQVGTDIEDLQDYANRCINQWNQLSAVPTVGFYENIVRETPFVGNQVEQVIVFPDLLIGGKVNVVVSGPDGFMSPNTIQLIQENVSTFAPLTDNPIVFAPSTANIDFIGTITVSVSSGAAPSLPLPNIQTAVTEALISYVQSILINGTIEISKVIKIIMSQTGIEDVATTAISGQTQLGIVVNGTPTNINYVLGSSSSFVKAVAAPSQTNNLGQANVLFNFSWIVVS